jgi:anti-sigma B factor antagonist
MNITRSEENGVTVLAFAGRLDTSTTASADQAFAAELAAGAKNFVWDFAELTYISSAGLRSVLQALKQVHARGGKLAVCSLSHNIQDVFDISGFKSLLTICPDRSAAVAAVG